MGAEQLGSFIIEIYGINKNIDKRIKALLAQTGASAFVNQLTVSIKSLRHQREYIDYRESSELAAEIEQRITDIMSLQTTEPYVCLKLIELLIDTANNSLGRCDDSNGEVGNVYRSLSSHWLSIAGICYQLEKQQAPAEKKQLASKWQQNVKALVKKNDYGTMDNLLSNANQLFTKIDVLTLIKDYQTQYDDCINNQGLDADDYKVINIAIYLEELAMASGDVALYERIYLQVNTSGTPNAIQIEDMLAFFYEQQAFDRALYYLNEVWQSDNRYDQISRLDWLITIYEAMGALKQKLATMGAVFELDPTPMRLKAILAIVPTQDKTIWQQKALKLAKQEEDIIQKLHLLLELGEIELLDSTAITAATTLAQSRYYYSLTELLDKIPSGAYLSKVVIYRSLLNDILDSNRNKDYDHAANYYKQLQQLDKTFTKDKVSYEGLVNHKDYDDCLQDNHSKKCSFWKRVND